MRFNGLPVSRGIAVGRVLHYAPQTPESLLKMIAALPGFDNTRTHFEAALETAREELTRLIAGLEGNSPDQAKILRAHLEIAEDETLAEDVAMAMEDGLSLGEAVYTVFGQYIVLYARSKEERIRERTADLSDVRNRILRILAQQPERDLSALAGPVVVVAYDLLPADTAGIDRRNVLGIVTQIGGETSHTSIIARSYGIPCVVGVSGITDAVAEGDEIIVDAVSGTVITAPAAEETEHYTARRRMLLTEQADAESYLHKPCRLQDGTEVAICVNVAQISADALAAASYADGVGLLRTEFLYMNRATVPSEEEQTAAYRRVLEAFAGKPVVLRTLDIGGDKKVDCLTLPVEQNPFLGERALRLCFAQPALFRTQLRAALRASVYGELWIMFPMVASVEDFCRAKEMLLEEKAALLAAGEAVSDSIRIGAMIEIPAMAISADALAAVADFASIGSNDLTQYLLAVDRTEPAVAPYCQKYHPAVFRAIAMAADAFTRAGKPISICGELGGDPLAAPALVGCGVRKLSMSSSPAAIKKHLAGVTLTQCRALSASLLAASTAAETERLLRTFTNEEGE